MYWIYENWRAEKKAMVHFATCSFCNAGAGTQRNKQENRNGRWVGPFDTFDIAWNFAVELDDREAQRCSRCC